MNQKVIRLSIVFAVIFVSALIFQTGTARAQNQLGGVLFNFEKCLSEELIVRDERELLKERAKACVEAELNQLIADLVATGFTIDEVDIYVSQGSYTIYWDSFAQQHIAVGCWSLEGHILLSGPEWLRIYLKNGG